MPLFLAAITTFFTDSNEEIFNGKLELPQTSILCFALEKISNIVFTTSARYNTLVLFGLILLLDGIVTLQ